MKLPVTSRDCQSPRLSAAVAAAVVCAFCAGVLTLHFSTLLAHMYRVLSYA